VEISKRDNLASSINPHELGKAMAELHLENIPPEKRHMAIMDHMIHIMIGTIEDAAERDKLIVAWLRFQKSGRSR